MPVEIDNQYHNVYVLKRPGVDEFMRKMGEIYEIVVFTASLSKVMAPHDGVGHTTPPSSRCQLLTITLLSSMPTLFWTCWTYTRL